MLISHFIKKLWSSAIGYCGRALQIFVEIWW